MSNANQQVFIIDDDEAVRDSLGMLLETADLPHHCFASANDFLKIYDGTQRGCLILDIRMPGISGFELQEKLNVLDALIPIIFITVHGDISMAVEAVRQGALDFIRKPVQENDLLDRIQQALDHEKRIRDLQQDRQAMEKKLASLTPREEEVLEHVADGLTNKFIAFELGLSERTVEFYRSQLMKKLKVRNFAQLIRIKVESERASRKAATKSKSISPVSS